MSTQCLARLASNFGRDIQFYIYKIFSMDPNSGSVEYGVYIITDTKGSKKPYTHYSLN